MNCRGHTLLADSAACHISEPQMPQKGDNEMMAEILDL